MRLEPRNLVLLLLLAALVGVDLGTRRGTRPGGDGPLLGELFGVRPWRLVLARGEERVELLRRPVDEQGAAAAFGPWTVASARDYPADERRVEGLLDRLRSLRTLDVVAEGDGAHAAYGLAGGAPDGEEPLRITVAGAESSGRPERVLADLLVGRPPGSASVPHVRRLDGSRVLRAPALEMPPTEASAWLAPDWVGVEASWVERIVVELADEAPREVLRVGVDRWEGAEGGRARAEDARELLLGLEDLRPAAVLERLEDGGSGLELELALDLVLEEGQRVRLEFGAERAGLRPARRIGSPWVVAVEGPAYHALLSRARALSGR